MKILIRVSDLYGEFYLVESVELASERSIRGIHVTIAQAIQDIIGNRIMPVAIERITTVFALSTSELGNSFISLRCKFGRNNAFFASKYA